MLRLPTRVAFFALLVVGSPVPLAAQGTARLDSARAHVVDTIRVLGRSDDLIGVASSASEGRVGAVELRQRPLALLGAAHDVTVGAETRADCIDALGLYRTEKQVRVATVDRRGAWAVRCAPRAALRRSEACDGRLATGRPRWLGVSGCV